MKHHAHVAGLVLVAALASGCASLTDGRSKVTKFSPGDLINQPMDRVDIVGLLAAPGQTRPEPSPLLEGDAFVKALDQALSDFAASGRGTKEARNRIQDRLIMASNVLCEDYKVSLKRKQAGFNFGFGTAATLFGAAGALVPYAETAKILSGAAAATTGIRAEYNEDFYANITAHVITKAINLRRGDILDGLRDARKTPLAEYSMEAAIGDAVTYHGACTLISGLEVADKAVSALGHKVGLDTTLKILSSAEKPEAPPVTK